MERSRIPEFYKRSVTERLQLLLERGLITAEDFETLAAGGQVLSCASADKMVENVIGVFGLPLGLGLNFCINQRDYVVPLVVEEPSIVAALSSAAKLARDSGGFTADSSEPVLIGQIQLVDVAHAIRAQHVILQNREQILNLANSLHPKMVARGGGALDVEVNIHPSASSRGDMVIVHLAVNTCDAMGANLVNTMCEGVAPLIEKLTGGKVFLRILSNLTDRAMVRARAVFSTASLKGKGYSGDDVRDGIILANDFAAVDPYRAATHNKGIMNGIDAVAIATGNDWRAIEAAAHAYAGRGTTYTSLTQWFKDDAGNLVGQIAIPLKVGTVGGNFQSNPAVPIMHRILGIKSARELACVMGAVGLAQNFSALRALVTDGIQQGHMTLHARSVVMSAGAPAEMFDTVVERLVECGEIKLWKAQEIIASLQPPPPQSTGIPVRVRPATPPVNLWPGAGHGKVVLLGEHAVVYGSHAIAAPIPLAIQARVDDAQTEGVHLVIPSWGVEGHLRKNDTHNSLHASLTVILNRLGLRDRNMSIAVQPHIPRAMGLGGSAALAVAVIRALSSHYGLNLGDEDVNGLAFESEKVAHGTPSGIDNALATFGRFTLFKKGQPPTIKTLHVKHPLPIVIGLSGVEGLTAKTVAAVQRGHARHPAMYERIFAEIDALTLEGVAAIEAYDLPHLGELMNVCHGMLNALQVSSWELEELVEIARKHGAVGAKLTGGGGGGSMIALCPEHGERVAEAMRKSGYQAIVTTIGA